MTTITVLGNFSGRNVGDNAILGNLLADISRDYPDVLFKIPTFSKRFVEKHYGQYNIKAMGLKPWDGALKIFGISTFRAMLETDLVLITDNILFDRSFFNPLFNYLSTISLIAPLCQKRNIPIVPYNASLGPFNSRIGRRAVQRVLDAAPFGIVRDELSIETLDRNHIRYTRMHRGADCAINTPLPAERRIEEMARQEGLFTNPKGTLSFNINPYIDSWIQSEDKRLGRKEFTRNIAGAMDELMRKLGVDIMFTTTQTMDYTIVEEVMAQLELKERVKVVGNTSYTYQELTGLLHRCGLHVGMRTHSKILAAAAHTPMVTINAYPKSVGFVKTIGMGDWVINLEDLNQQSLVEIVERAWLKRDELRAAMIPRVIEEQAKALSAVRLIGPLIASGSAADSTAIPASTSV